MVSHKTQLVVLFVLSIVLASCGKSPVGPGKGQDLVLTPIEQQKVTADNAFTLKLFKNLDSANTANTNLFVSPLSVSFAMGMTNNGSSGETLAAINNTMNFNGFTQDEVNSYYHDIITNLPLLDPNTTLKIANSIWYRQDFSVLPAFIKTNTTSYNAKVQALDFNNSTASLSTINNWVSAQTLGAIPSVLNNIDSQDEMYLINALYFKSGWKEKFDASKTKPLPFYLADNSTVQANFMDGTIDFKRYDDNDADIFELPYSNSKYSLVIVMPASGKTVQQLVTALDSNKWKTWMNGLTPINEELKLPKFTFKYNVNLNNALKALGMGIAFGDQANFSLINATTPLHISKVLQQDYVDVDENGTTAAAVTTVVIGISVAYNPPPTIIDHPFIFAIRQMSSGLILFAGTVNNPNQTGQ